MEALQYCYAWLESLLFFEHIILNDVIQSLEIFFAKDSSNCSVHTLAIHNASHWKRVETDIFFVEHLASIKPTDP
jgi:hypothetical protein